VANSQHFNKTVFGNIPLTIAPINEQNDIMPVSEVRRYNSGISVNAD